METTFEQLIEAHKRMQGRHDAALVEYRRARVAKNDAGMDRWFGVMTRRLRSMMRLNDAAGRVIG